MKISQGILGQRSSSSVSNGGEKSNWKKTGRGEGIEKESYYFENSNSLYRLHLF